MIFAPICIGLAVLKSGYKPRRISSNMAAFFPVRITARFVIVVAAVAFSATWFGCARRETAVQRGNREQVLLRGNGAEPQDLDPQTVTGIPEDHILLALFEGLVSE